ncbi:MAG TPA: hypothetical protein PL151_12420 [Phycisphaerae bacterium]|nr:hypothetical protein [Phycisphaerae bacterium]HOJ73371.1 hypothetical protein [Phycisphaerae bacterium]HOM50980.1 hypothetical protein [Phycisphaerae bacterium]HON66437.1 hypothetical protein [Phycisphaerae bacterium]HOQ86405.1 hypothetical protein [Phycisphaerae bacterium]
MTRSENSSTKNRVIEPDHLADRVTATELIDGVQHLLVLEQDATGCYREVILEPISPPERHAAAVPGQP